jgi:hypothetical protein
VVKKETYQRAGVVAKKYKILADGEALEEEEFIDDIEGTFGAYRTTNQYSVKTLKARLKQKNLLINKLEARLEMIEANARGEANKGFEQARVTDQQEIERLKSNLEHMHQSAQISQTQVSQQEEKIKLLQSKLISVENQVIDITVFQSQAIEIRNKVEVAQRDLLAKVETIQNHFHMI